MPVYNRTQFINEAIHSLLNQEYGNIEVIIIDDGTEIDIENFIKKKCFSNKIKFFHKSHTGLSDSLNEGICRASGEYLVFLDDDDLLHPLMILTCINIAQNTNVDMVAVGYEYFKGSKNSFQAINHQPIITDIPDILSQLTSKNLFPVNTILIRKNIIESVGAFDTQMNSCMDWDLWLRIIARGAKLAIIKENLSFIRIHGNNMSKNESLMHEGRLEVLRHAEQYMTSKQKRNINLKQKITMRMLVAGWYILLYKSPIEGRKIISSAALKNILLFIPSVTLLCISFFPIKLLQKFTHLCEFILKRQNIYCTAQCR